MQIKFKPFQNFQPSKELCDSMRREYDSLRDSALLRASHLETVLPFSRGVIAGCQFTALTMHSKPSVEEYGRDGSFIMRPSYLPMNIIDSREATFGAEYSTGALLRSYSEQFVQSYEGIGCAVLGTGKSFNVSCDSGHELEALAVCTTYSPSIYTIRVVCI